MRSNKAGKSAKAISAQFMNLDIIKTSVNIFWIHGENFICDFSTKCLVCFEDGNECWAHSAVDQLCFKGRRFLASFSQTLELERYFYTSAEIIQMFWTTTEQVGNLFLDRLCCDSAAGYNRRAGEGPLEVLFWVEE